MAVTITRTQDIDDDGSYGYGTLRNNAWKQTIYNQIDAALALLLPLAGGTMTGDLKFTDATYDIGKSGATRPRDGFFSRNVTIGGTLAVTGAVSTPASVIVANWSQLLPGIVRTTDGSALGIFQAYDVAYRALRLDGASINLYVNGAALAGGFAAGDKYLIINAAGQVKVSALGPAS